MYLMLSPKNVNFWKSVGKSIIRVTIDRFIFLGFWLAYRDWPGASSNNKNRRRSPRNTRKPRNPEVIRKCCSCRESKRTNNVRIPCKKIYARGCKNKIRRRLLGALLQHRVANRSDAVVEPERVFPLPQPQSVFQHQQRQETRPRLKQAVNGAATTTRIIIMIR